MRVDLGLRRAPFQHVRRLGAQLLDRAAPRPRDRLVAGEDQPLQPDGAVDRGERHQRLHRGAVRVGDDPPVAVQRLGVDLGDDQRDVLVHAPVAGVVDDHSAGLDQPRRPLGTDRAAGGGEDEVEAGDRLFAERAALEQLAVPLDLPARRALRGEGDHLAGREAPLGEHLEDGRTDRPGRAQHPDPVSIGRHRRISMTGGLDDAHRGKRPVRPQPCRDLQPRDRRARAAALRRALAALDPRRPRGGDRDRQPRGARRLRAGQAADLLLRPRGRANRPAEAQRSPHPLPDPRRGPLVRPAGRTARWPRTPPGASRSPPPAPRP